MGIVLRKGLKNNTAIVQNGQNIFDFCLQTYGTLEQLFTIFADNEDIDINTDLVPQQQLVVSLDVEGDNAVTSFFLVNDYITNNADEDFASTEGDKQFQDGEFAKFQNNEFYKYN